MKLWLVFVMLAVPALFASGVVAGQFASELTPVRVLPSVMPPIEWRVTPMALQEPPPDLVCHPRGAVADTVHDCDCHRICQGDDPTRVQEDPQCKTYCAPKQCSCGVECP